jgi:predicted CopG family antitoxin
MATTIQISETAKRSLDRLKKEKQTYEEVILNLMKIVEVYKREQKQLLVEGYKEMAEESLRIAKEWEGTLMDGLNKNEKWNRL